MGVMVRSPSGVDSIYPHPAPGCVMGLQCPGLPTCQRQLFPSITGGYESASQSAFRYRMRNASIASKEVLPLGLAGRLFS